MIVGLFRAIDSPHRMTVMWIMNSYIVSVFGEDVRGYMHLEILTPLALFVLAFL